MSDAILIALITGGFAIVGKVVDILLARARAAEAAPAPRRRRRADAVNPFTLGGILNPATIGFLVVGIIVGVIIVNATGGNIFGGGTPTPTEPATPEPTESHTDVPVSDPSGLVIGEQAITHTTGGDRLRVREQPGFDAATIERLDPATVVTVIGGPQTVGTDKWWQIEFAEGRSGWVVEQVEGVQTILPLAP